MSIATEITALTTDRNNIRTVLANKEISASDHGFDDFATDIGNIVGESSFIVVTAPTGSTVTCDGVSVSESSGTWTFGGIAIGTHTIVATKVISGQTYTNTVTQLVDVVGIYPVTITYSRLPSGYTEVEYIQSSGTQYIDTGITPVVGDSMTCEFNIIVSGNTVVFGERTSGIYSTSNNQFYLYVNVGCFIDVYNGISHERIGSFELNQFKCISCEVNSSMSEQPTQSVYLFSLNDCGSVNNTTQCKIKSFTIAGKRNFVPCINPSNVVGMYDLVSNTFFGNSGTGVFIAGSPV